MQLENLKVGTYKNYKEMCRVLDEKVTTGGAKQNQVKKWANYFKFYMKGNKYVVQKIYDTVYVEEVRDPSNYSGYRHGLSRTKIYRAWTSMKQRCYNVNSPNYKHYGDRGITVCDEWLDEQWGFLNFYNWSIENGHQANLSIDRIDVNKEYGPKNCRWTTMKNQNWNKRNTIHVPGKLQMSKGELIKYLRYLEKYLNQSQQSDVIKEYINIQKGDSNHE